MVLYHTMVETIEYDKNKKNKSYFKLDQENLHDIISRLLVPYQKGDEFQFDGIFLTREKVARIKICRSNISSEVFSKTEMEKAARNGVFITIGPSSIFGFKEYSTDITDELFDEAKKLAPPPSQATITTTTSGPAARKVFLVHGREEGNREAVARFIQHLGFEPIILHEQANGGRTVIEKIEAHGDVAFAVVLLTPDDEGCLKGGTPIPRARQNVVLELGYFISRLGRKRICALKRGDVEIPSDFGGVVYETFDSSGGWKQVLGRELEEAGFG